MVDGADEGDGRDEEKDDDQPIGCRDGVALSEFAFELNGDGSCDGVVRGRGAAFDGVQVGYSPPGSMRERRFAGAFFLRSVRWLSTGSGWLSGWSCRRKLPPVTVLLSASYSLAVPSSIFADSGASGFTVEEFSGAMAVYRR